MQSRTEQKENFFISKSYECNILKASNEHCYENKTRSKKLNLDNKCFQQL